MTHTPGSLSIARPCPAPGQRDVSLRSATSADAEALTRIIHLASEGMALSLWQHLAGPEGDPWEIGRSRASRESGGFSWRNARLAERGGEVAGGLIGYLLHEARKANGPDTPAIFRPLIELENRAIGSWYVNVLATLEGHRRQKVAESLIIDAARRASGRDLSLIVADGNDGGRAFYRALGFGYVAEAPVALGFGWQTEHRAWFLMRRPAAAGAG